MCFQARGRLYKRLLCVITLAALMPPCAALGPARAEESTIWLEGSYRSSATPQRRVWSFPYNDELFNGPDDEYVHALAQASLGMALSAFRDNDAPPDGQDEAVRKYLEQAGFDGLAAEQYDITPSVDTIATMIGHKALGNETVIAVAVSGAGYGDEWLSNFDIGDGARHAGFGGAADKVCSRIRDYIKARGITGDIKLWISGYSRAAAVSNLTAADMTDSGLLKGVYAYTFATPRTTREPGEYGNIFNIVGKFDPVSVIPFAEWGYARHGVDLYTPAQETDSDYRQKKEMADEVSVRLTGMPFWNSVNMNNNLHTIMDYLYNVLPTAALYDEKMKPILQSVWKDRSLPNMSDTIVRLMEEADLLDLTQKYEMEYLLDYLSMTTYTTIAGQANWNSKTTMAENLMHEHSPDVYVEWMFASGDPDDIFTDSLNYLRLSYQGPAKITITDKDGKFCLSIDEYGVTSDWPAFEELHYDAPPIDERPLIAVERKGTQTVITLPKDSDYMLFLEALKTETLTYFGTQYAVGGMRGDLSEVCMSFMQEGQLYAAMSFGDDYELSEKPIYGDSDIAFSPWSEELPYSPSVIMMMENENVFHISFTQLTIILGAAALLLLSTITLATVSIVKRRRRKKINNNKEETEHAANT